MNLPTLRLSPLADVVISNFERHDSPNHEQKIRVNPVVSKVAVWYEKLRNAMEYREDEVILRAAIERILKRRLLLGGNAQTTAEPLVRELVWARYLGDNAVPQSDVKKVEDSINYFLSLRLRVLKQHKISETTVNEWIYHLMSSDIEHIVNPNPEKESVNNFMYQILKDQITITDDSEETKNAQVYLAVRRSFSRDDLAFLRYHLFKLYFGPLNPETLDTVSEHFIEGYKEILSQLKHPRKERIYTYVKRRTATFFILEDILHKRKSDIRRLVTDQIELEKAIFDACNRRYSGIQAKIRRAIVRSVLFILFTKVIFAFAVEGTYERLVYGEILWKSIIVNTSMPPLLMIVVSLFIRTPGQDNSKRIASYIGEVLFHDTPVLGEELAITRKRAKQKPIAIIFTILWILAFVISFGGINYVLDLLSFNPISKLIFVFFLTIVSFLSYRISLTANLYTVGERTSIFTPFVDFLFMPVVRVGRHLTAGISQINILIFLLDFIIETPFKLVFAFAEQWFHFLHSKREDLG